MKLVKTENLGFDQRVELAMVEARRITEEEKSPQKKIVLIQILHAVIGYRIAEHLSLDDDKKWYIEKVNGLYALLPRIKLKKEEAKEVSRKMEEMSKIIREIIVPTDYTKLVQKKRSW